MARAVFDKVVRANCENQGMDDIYYQNVKIYATDVKETIEKIKLDVSKFGLPKESITNSLNKRYEAIQIIQDKCYIVMGGNSFPATKEQIRLLKALAIEQVNRNEEYSFIVYQIFIRFLKQIVTKSITYDFTDETDNWTPMQQIVLEAFTAYIKKLLGSSSLLTHE